MVQQSAVAELYYLAGGISRQSLRVLEFATNLTEGIQQSELIETKTEEVQFSDEKLHEMMVNWKRGFDSVKGGNNRAPKFPMPNKLEIMIEKKVQHSRCIFDF